MAQVSRGPLETRNYDVGWRTVVVGMGSGEFLYPGDTASHPLSGGQFWAGDGKK